MVIIKNTRNIIMIFIGGVVSLELLKNYEISRFFALPVTLIFFIVLLLKLNALKMHSNCVSNGIYFYDRLSFYKKVNTKK